MRVLLALLTAAALGAAASVLLTAGSWRAALRVLLDLLTAVGLLRLAGTQGWRDIAAAAAIVVLRRVLWAALTPRRTDRPAAGRPADDVARAAGPTITPYRG